MNMKFSLSKFLEKRGIDKVEDLTNEELEVFARYQAILSGETVSIESVKKFCKSQIELIESRCDGINPLTLIQQGSLHVYMNILKAIEAPEKEREALERHLTQIIES